MMASPSELTLDFKPHSYSMLLKSVGDQTQNKLEDFLSRLEEERLKIDAFKRELPLCMQLLTNAMEASRQQLQTYLENQEFRPVLEEFIPIKKSSSGGSENMSDKANWITSAQLWSHTSEVNNQQSKETDIGFIVSTKLGLDAKQRNSGAFLPFSNKERNSYPNPIRPLPELALTSIDKEIADTKCTESDIGMSCSRRDHNTATSVTDQQGICANAPADSSQTTTTSSQTHRKARRCWSPDLHRRFVNALQILGGSQVATPKQIRELMKVDGLTNDEVKSHLQKYRLHTRRPSPSPQVAVTPSPQLVVLGGIWVPSEYATPAHHAGAPTLYGAHPTTHASAHYCAQPIPQEFYSAAPPQSHHYQLHMQNPSSQDHSSPESDVGGNSRGRSESIEDVKSESSSWKADRGGENGGERKRLVRREEGEESNGSEITLKV